MRLTALILYLHSDRWENCSLKEFLCGKVQIPYIYLHQQINMFALCSVLIHTSKTLKISTFLTYVNFYIFKCLTFEVFPKSIFIMQYNLLDAKWPRGLTRQTFTHHHHYSYIKQRLSYVAQICVNRYIMHKNGSLLLACCRSEKVSVS